MNIRAMNSEEFNFLKNNDARTDYIEGMMKTQNISYEVAKERADKQFNELLPDGLETSGHEFFSILYENKFAGYTWFKIDNDERVGSCWLYDIYVKENFRRQGIATKLFDHMENYLKEKNIKQLSFHVFAHNQNAIELYKKRNYEVTNLVMRKLL